MRLTISVLASCLLSHPTSVRGENQNVIMEIIENNNYIGKNVNQRIRELWDFDQDDFFLEHTTQVPTVTSAPSLSQAPSHSPSNSVLPTSSPTGLPTQSPTSLPTNEPSYVPTMEPSVVPSPSPTQIPTSGPSGLPTKLPSQSPSDFPTLSPTSLPTSNPSTSPSLSISPSSSPTESPSRSINPTKNPSGVPSISLQPSNEPSRQPSREPSLQPSLEPSRAPSDYPSLAPSTSPSDTPTKTPTSIPSFIPSASPSREPSLLPSASPSLNPTLTPSLSLKPSAKPSLSIAPSSNPTLSHVPTVLLRDVDISPFVIELVSVNQLPDVVDKQVAEVAGQFLTSYLNDELPSQYRFLYVELEPDDERRDRRRLNVKKTTACSGIAVFNSKEIPETNMVDDLILEAFSNPESKRLFLNLLKNSGTSLSQVLNVGAEDLRRKPVLTAMQQAIIITIASVALAAIALSFYIQHRLKRGSEKRVKDYGLHYAAHTNEAEMEIDFLEPQPLGISDDDRAIERNLIRSQHERTIMRKANAKLKESSAAISHRKASVRFSETVQYDSTGFVDEDEEATISSIQFSNSLESSISSLGGLNPIAREVERKLNEKQAPLTPVVELESQTIHPDSITIEEGIQGTPSITSPLEIGALSPESASSQFTFGSISTKADLVKDASIDFSLGVSSKKSNIREGYNSLDTNINEGMEVGAIFSHSAQSEPVIASPVLECEEGNHSPKKKKIGSFFKRIASPKKKAKSDAKKADKLLGSYELAEDSAGPIEKNDQSNHSSSSPFNEIGGTQTDILKDAEDKEEEKSVNIEAGECAYFSNICTGQGIEGNAVEGQVEVELSVTETETEARGSSNQTEEDHAVLSQLKETETEARGSSNQTEEDHAVLSQLKETETEARGSSNQSEEDHAVMSQLKKAEGENSYFTSIFTRRY